MSKRGSRTGWEICADRETSSPYPVQERPTAVLVRPDDPAPLAEPDFPAVIDLATLDGTNGVRLDGLSGRDESGTSVSSAGDVNGDGFDDVIIGTFYGGAGYSPGESYVVFGRADGIPASFDLGSLNGRNGFRLEGADPGDDSGRSVSSAGDVNGDGFDDIIIGAPTAGESYVVFGKAGGFSATFDLGALDGSNGFAIGSSVGGAHRIGFAVSSAGDISGDGFDDVIVGAYNASPGGDRSAGESYVVFGKAGGRGGEIDLATLDGTNGFRLDGIDRNDESGGSVSSAGDVNGDGFDDIIIGARYAGVGYNSAGQSYVVFGKADGFAASIDLATLDGTNGFRLDGSAARGQSGFSVSLAGDVNGDGFDDIIIGARFADPGGDSKAGESYVVFGKADGFAASFDLGTLDGTNGFRLEGLDQRDYNGTSVSDAGDVNGDGFDDIIIGAFGGDPGGDRYAGESYVVFGKAGGFDANIDLAALDGSNGFRIDGVDIFDRSGVSVSSGGDVNGDGFDDIIIGADGGDAGGDSSGETYVVFGRAPTDAVTRIGSAADQTIRGGDFNDTLRGKQGDDVLIGGNGDDWLRGGQDADELVGGTGSDRMNGGDGHDNISGGAGADVFVIASAAAEDSDEILDFAAGEDGIVLGGDTFPLDEGALADGSFVIGDAAADANDRLIYDDTTGNLFFDTDGTGAQAQVLIATLTGAPVLTAGDFVVI